MNRKGRQKLKLLIFVAFVTILVRWFYYKDELIVRRPPIFTSDCDDYCYARDENRRQNRYFASLSTYPKISISEFRNHVTVPNCRPVKIWSLFRHGARSPSVEQFPEFQQLYTIRDEILANYEIYDQPFSTPQNCKLCKEDLENIKNWKLFDLPTGNRKLTQQGWSDLGYLAKSYQAVFPELFDQHYSPKTYLLRHTIEERTASSYEAFVHHLFGNDAHLMINLPPPPIADKILMPYTNCTEADAHSKQHYREPFKFVTTKDFRKMLQSVVFKLRLVNTTNVNAVWKMCQYEQSWDENKLSPWCAAFSPSGLRMLDYWEDLNLYSMKSHGFRLNTELTCNTVVDMFKHLQNANNSPKVVAYFVHSTLMFLVFTTLGLIRDAEPIRADNYYRMHDRRFRSSEKVPFSANFAAVKYECKNDPDKQKVMFLVNQKPVRFKQCRDAKICTWAEVTSILERYNDNNCDKVFCTNNTLSDLFPSQEETNPLVGFFKNYLVL